MDQSEQLKDDLHHVRTAVKRSDRELSGPPAISFLWAGIVLIGFALVDVRPEWSGLYWAIMAPLGFIASLILGWRHAQRIGEADRTEGARVAGHWFAMLAAIGLAVPLAIAGDLSGSVFGQLILLILAFGYLTAGLHFDRWLLVAALVMVVGYATLFFISTYVWTLMGVAVAAALAVSGFLSLKRSRPIAE